MYTLKHKDKSGPPGFTLIEVIVTVAILSILTGLMLPMAGKVWERNEDAETRGKLVQLKKAIVGDKSQMQNGIRMHFGFVGDNGTLPDALSDLVEDPTTFANWNGPYLFGGFDPAAYNIDAWGKSILYEVHSPPLLVNGLSVVATLRSGGVDGVFGTADDLDENTEPTLQIFRNEVWPTDTVQGNVNFLFSTVTSQSKLYSFDLYVDYAIPTSPGKSRTSSGCIPLTVGTVVKEYPKSLPKAFSSSLGTSLPVGRVDVGSHLYSDAVCGNMIGETSEVAVFVSDGMGTVSVNMPTLHYVIP